MAPPLKANYSDGRRADRSTQSDYSTRPPGTRSGEYPDVDSGHACVMGGRPAGRASACVSGCVVASRDRLRASQWVIAAANFECGRNSKRVTGDRGFELEGRSAEKPQPDSFTRPWNVRKRAPAAADVVADISLWTYQWEACPRALLRHRTHPASWLSWSRKRPQDFQVWIWHVVSLVLLSSGVFLSF